MMKYVIVVVAFVAFVVWNDNEVAKHVEYAYGFDHAEYCNDAGVGTEHCADEE